MMELVLEERRPLPFAAMFWLLVAAAPIAVGVANQQWDWFIFAILPLMIGTLLLVTRPAPFRAELTQHGVRLDFSGDEIPYDQIAQVTFLSVGTRGDRGQLHVAHENGEFLIPEIVGQPTADVYTFLIARIPHSRLPVMPEMIEEFYRSQIEMFGTEKVSAHAARSEITIPPAIWGRYVGPGMVLTAVAWFAASAILNRPVWVVAAFLLLCITPPVWITGYHRPKKKLAQVEKSGLALVLLFGVVGAGIYSASRKRASKLHDACLVIGPQGIALSQGELQGQLRWAELKRIRIRKGAFLSAPVLELRVEGARIDIPDIYSTPLTLIHREIDAFWQAG